MNKIVYKGKEIDLEDYIILMLDKGYSDIIEEVTLPDSTIKGKWRNYIKSENVLIDKNKIEEYKEIINNHKDKVQDYKDYVNAIDPVKILSNNKIKKSKKINKKVNKKNIVQEELPDQIDFSNFNDFDQLNELLELQNNSFNNSQEEVGITEDERMEIRKSIAKQLTEGTYFNTSDGPVNNAIDGRRKQLKSGKNRLEMIGSNNSIEELRKEKEEEQYKDKSDQEVIRIKRNKSQVLDQMFK